MLCRTSITHCLSYKILGKYSMKFNFARVYVRPIYANGSITLNSEISRDQQKVFQVI